ncbi:hypothetical protein GCM10023215_44360 [Pseudonocardia yuanmonensis]|uniref:Uncharacterized protein n=1 Tax=Pseudonocardia yuanmonensis TaxID=1095914 RepID=A0ABP8X4L1_9PSEU
MPSAVDLGDCGSLLPSRSAHFPRSPQFQASGVAQSDFYFVDKSAVDFVQGQATLSRRFPGGTGSSAIVLIDAGSRIA